MTRDELMRARLNAQECLESKDEAVRTAAQIVLRNLPAPPPDFIQHREREDG